MPENAFKKAMMAFLAVSVLASSFPATALAGHDDDRYEHRRYDDRHGRGHGHERGHGHWRGHDNHHRNGVFFSSNYYAPVQPVYVRQVYSNQVYVEPAPTYRTRVSCTRSYNPLPTILGGAAGGAIGSRIGKGQGRTAAIIGGALVGGMLGGQYGSTVQNCVEQVFEATPSGTAIAWEGPQNSYYSVTPTRDYRQDGRYCREYQSVSTIGGNRNQTYGTACMQPDGSWEVVN